MLPQNTFNTFVHAVNPCELDDLFFFYEVASNISLYGYATFDVPVVVTCFLPPLLNTDVLLSLHSSG